MPLIKPITDLRKTTEISDICHSKKEPIFITKNGYGDMVIMSIENFEKTTKKLKMYQDLEESEKQIREGNVTDARKSLAIMRKKYGL